MYRCLRSSLLLTSTPREGVVNILFRYECIKIGIRSLKPSQAGFGWTNGVVLWIASTYGNQLNAPNCPSLLVTGQGQRGTSSAGHNVIPVFGAMATMIIGAMAWNKLIS